jgi:SHS2 domain-containing protein
MNRRGTSSEQGSFVEIEHTADIAIEVTSETLAGLFATSAKALFSLIADPVTIEPREEIAVSVSAGNTEDLLHAWLSELLAQFNLTGFIGSDCRINATNGKCVEGTLKGEPLDLARHRFYTEIKGVTYHDFRVWQENDSWRARIVFDV